MRQLARLLVRGALHRMRHGSPKEFLGAMGSTLRAITGATIERCACGAIEVRIFGGDRVTSERAKLCPTFELRDRLRRRQLPRAVARRR